MKDANDRKAYDSLVLDNMDGINNRLEKFMADQVAHNLTVAQRISIVETKALLWGGLLGTIGGSLVSALVAFVLKK